MDDHGRSRVDDLIGELHARSDRADAGDRQAVLDPDALAAVDALLETDDGVAALAASSRLLVRRVLVNESTADTRPDSMRALLLSGALYRLAPDLVDDELRARAAAEWTYDPQDVAVWAQRAAALLRVAGNDPDLLGDTTLVADLVVRRTPDDHPDRARRLAIGAVAHGRRFAVAGGIADVDRAVECAADCVAATPESDPRLGDRLVNLGAAHGSRFAATGRPDDLTRAVEVFTAALDRVDGAARADCLANLAVALVLRWLHLGHAASLDGAVERCREAVREPRTEPGAGQAGSGQADDAESQAWATLGIACRIRFNRFRQFHDIQEAVSAFERAQELAQRADSQRAAVLSGYAATLRVRFAATGGTQTGDIDAAIAAGREATALAVVSAGTRARLLASLGAALLTRSRHRTDGLGPDDLHEAIEVLEHADQLLADGEDPIRATILGNLGVAHRRLADHAWPDDRRPGSREAALRAAAAAHARAAAVGTAPPLTRAVSAYEAGRVDAGSGEWNDAAVRFGTALDLLDTITADVSERDDLQHLVGQLIGLGPAAAAVALRTGATPQDALAAAERGRAVLLAQSLATRRAVRRLHADHPALANRLATVESLLSRTEADPLTPRPRPVALRRTLESEQATLLAQIRGKPGFGRFLLPTAADEILADAGPGPVALLNVTPYGCDALLLADGAVHRIQAPLRYGPAIEQANEFLTALRVNDHSTNPRMLQVLRWLWEAVARPVLDAVSTSLGRPPERICWIPTGPLSVLPLHAAGRHDAPGESVLDRVISSYSPSVRTLASATGTGRGGPTPSGRLVVAVPDAPGHALLSEATAEAATVARLWAPRTLRLDDEDATPSRVVDALRTCGWAHFACHGVSSADPADSRLVLHGGALTVRDIAALDLGAPYLAFLSACSTADGGTVLVDEAIHVSSAFWLAGFQHVIGTLWRVNDWAARQIAEAVYQHPLADRDPALALHTAVTGLRQRYPDNPQLWAAHTHLGSSQ